MFRILSLALLGALSLPTQAALTPDVRSPGMLGAASAEPAAAPLLDGSQHARRGRGADDAPGHIRRGRGADDAPGHIRRGRGSDDAPGHLRRGRGRDDVGPDDRGGRRG